MVKPRTHSVRLVHEELDVLQVGRCTCGWRIGYDCSSYDTALRRAQEHCEAELEADLEAELGAELDAGPEWSG